MQVAHLLEQPDGANTIRVEAAGDHDARLFF